ncbi:hypothetical protein I302_102041 [Kwoniella bestiolae CBS 10118]|uniref:DNA replication regulator SLD2 n=1 Tax=Kwoniella bestiolae CBS 10118 TaxID=1296100 RepID=A0A1B9GDV3_9TREE|nr:hypothetical protein I302_00726 [Kwoniella bestiolae CBS 10118]OCF29230.1 hypothetical protein I302_00726 [Kwoniella bestiolae CBS 10118]
MDLPTVKAAVKSWEKSFKAREGRNPTKEDIKADPSDIASQYALYRKLSKSSSSQSLHPPSSSTAIPSSASSSQYRSTPRTIPSSEYPTTPTPPSRRVSGSFFGTGPSSSQAGPSRSNSSSNNNSQSSKTNGQIGGEGKSLKRKASKSIISSPPHPIPTSSSSTSTSRTLFSTPKKKAYTGPIHDPNPINPFTTSQTPTKSPFPTPTNGTGLQREKSFSSPFIHASSPKKLKEVLEANSLKKVKERSGVPEITPRTRARKRLKGEEVEDTPLKERQPRRKRGQARLREEPLEDEEGTFLKPGIGRGSVFDEEDEEELGPSPIKVVQLGRGRGFTSLFGEGEVDEDDDEDGLPMTGGHITSRLNGVAENQAVDKGKGKSASRVVKKGISKSTSNGNGNGIMNFFNRTGSKPSLPKRQDINSESIDEKAIEAKSASPNPEVSTSVPSIEIQSPPLLEPTPSTDDIPLIDQSDMPPSPPIEGGDGPDSDSEQTHTPSASQRRREKVLNLSDDEIDEFDPEGGYVKREIRIVPTRREIKRRNSSDVDDEVEPEEEEGEENEQEEAVQDMNDHEEITSPTNPKSLSIPMLNLLSLHSPSKSKSKAQLTKARLEELRVKAIFSPSDAARLKALKRGQDISFTGEARVEDDETEEEGILEKYEFGLKDPLDPDEDGGEGQNGDGDGEAEREDDDWESESEGWKREQTEEDW